MSGLIWGGIGQGIANAGSTMGSYMMQSAMQEDRQEERRREKEEEARRQAERDALYRRTAEQQAAGKSGGGADGGMPAADIAEGGKAEGLVARKAGMTVPELRAMRKFSETGDVEPFKRGVERYKEEVEGADTTDAVSRKYAKQMGLTEIVRELPPGFDREARSKLQKLAEIEESYLLGGKYDDVTKGRRNQQEVNMSEAAIARPETAGTIGQGMAAGTGKALMGGDSNVTRNLFTGKTDTTDVGRSVISENQAQARQAGAKADALAAGEDPDVVNAKTADLQRKINSAKARLARELGVAENEINATLRSLGNNKSPDAQARLEKAKPFIDRLDQAQATMDEWKPGKTKPQPAPGPGSARPPASPASGVTRGGSRWTLQPS